MMRKEVPFRKILVIIDRLNVFKREIGWDEKRKMGKLESKQKHLKTKLLICFVFHKCQSNS